MGPAQPCPCPWRELAQRGGLPRLFPSTCLSSPPSRRVETRRTGTDGTRKPSATPPPRASAEPSSCTAAAGAATAMATAYVRRVRTREIYSIGRATQIWYSSSRINRFEQLCLVCKPKARSLANMTPSTQKYAYCTVVWSGVSYRAVWVRNVYPHDRCWPLNVVLVARWSSGFRSTHVNAHGLRMSARSVHQT